jgi:GNAT superfamily N-acetyltransferase
MRAEGMRVRPRTHTIEIRMADGGDALADARALFKEYASSLGRDLSMEDFARELAELPGRYGPPHGALLIAGYDGRVAGCVALRPLGEGLCEMKRLFVRHQFRGKGVGKRLALAVIDAARERGYRAMRIGFAPWMEEAIAIYRALGFRPIEAYRAEAFEGSVFLELALNAP